MAQFSNDEIKIVELSAPVWLKMLRERETRILDKIYGGFRSGQKDFLTDIAEYAVVREQIKEITNTLKQGE